MEHQEFLPRAFARFRGRRRRELSKGVRRTSAARGGAKERPAPSRPRRVGRHHDGAGPPTNTCMTLKWPASRVPSRLCAITIPGANVVRCCSQEPAGGLFAFSIVLRRNLTNTAVVNTETIPQRR